MLASTISESLIGKERRLMPTLQSSVGAGGSNRRADVLLIQTLLKAAGMDPGLIDGMCGLKTIEAIKKFQFRLLTRADGLVNQAGPTWLRLCTAAQAAPPAPTKPDPAADWSGDSSRWTQEKKLLSLEPGFRGKVKTVLGALTGRGFQASIFYGWRSVAVQQKLVAEGKSTVKFSFHNAQKPDGTPNSYAADIVDKRWGWDDAAETNGFWDALGSAAKTAGLVWGGDWTGFRDVAHVQGRQNGELAAVKKESGL
jgi:peptidoglycan L-alanyl-D-glutamate endopeptidase CwlK